MNTAADNATLPVVPNGADAYRGPAQLKAVEYLLIFGFWTLIALLSTANALFDPLVRGPSPIPRAVPVTMAFIDSYLWAALTPFIFWLAGRFSVESSNWLRRLLFFIAVGLAISIPFDMLTDLLRSEQVHAAQSSLGTLPSVTRVRRLWFMNEFLIYVAILAAGLAREYFLRYRARREEAIALQAQAAQLRAQLAGARLAALRTQLNPHFLFNTLHAVSALVERDPRGVRRMIARLSELLRISLDGVEETEVPLARELDFTRRYLEIMKIRFEGRLEIFEHIGPGAESAMVPNLLLQPLVENAFKHGVDRLDGSGRVEVRAELIGERLILSVSDNGPGIAGSSAADGLGLGNTRARLAQLYGSDQSLLLKSKPEGGAIVIVSLPYRPASELRTSAVAYEESRA
ncbi:MAG: sensor histidine kinase [Steroidobacteraceae bacterium]